ncbi:50S ribosomal protein L25 [Patescibacteria group bacterium]|nr:50S ribosomal protein L25 [Patescibacteria group bacterium]MBU1028927.1 50S ribosomal protein L25 [Patescibacteria group bacterium]MBU1915775.1 50S ribosomal protein L25 [Patescibacteria group bacterium]
MEFKLKAKIREATGNQIGALRRDGFMPAIIYGPGMENRNVSLDLREFEKIYDNAGESTLIDLEIGDEEQVKVIVQDIQRHPLKNQIIHADLFQVKMDEEITATIALEFIGESPAIKSLGGMLVNNLDSIEVRCLPTALVSHIEIDLSKLAELGDQITVGDIALPEGMEVLTEPDVSIVVVSAPSDTTEEVSPISEAEAVAAVAGEPKPEEGESKSE